MNQAQKRLKIIKLAISITDLETIQLQMLKLSPMKNDKKIEEILTLLQAESYGQAQALITSYLEHTPETVHQRSTKTTKEPEISEEDQAIIDEFKLFVTPREKETEEILEIDIHDYAPKQAKITKEKNTVDYDTLLNLDPNDVLTDNINIDISHKANQEAGEDTFFHTQAQESIDFLSDDNLPKDTFFEQEEALLEDETQKEDLKEALLSIDKADISNESSLNDVDNEEKLEEDTSLTYNPIPQIAHKLIAMKKQYPPIQKSYERFDTVEALLTKIAQHGYTETEMEEMISYIDQLIEKEKYTEASQLLLICGATESKYAQFMLARELYKGAILTKNIEESFHLMRTLATEKYPEALCDLGQFYENAVGTTQNLVKAKELYKEAYALGIKRAKKHYTRLKKINRGVFKS